MVRCWPRLACTATSRPASSTRRSSRCGPTSETPFHCSFCRSSAMRRRNAASRTSTVLDVPRSGHASFSESRYERRTASPSSSAGATASCSAPMRSPSSPTRASRAAVTRAPTVASWSSQKGMPSAPASSRRMARSRALRWARTRVSSTRSRAVRRSRWARIASRKRRRSDGEPTSSSISSGRKRTARTSSPSDPLRRASPLTLTRLRSPSGGTTPGMSASTRAPSPPCGIRQVEPHPPEAAPRGAPAHGRRRRVASGR